jgi:hypothetical protein
MPQERLPMLDEATRRSTVAQRAAKVGGAASALTGGMAPTSSADRSSSVALRSRARLW